jgi:hypothetical protein
MQRRRDAKEFDKIHHKGHEGHKERAIFVQFRLRLFSFVFFVVKLACPLRLSAFAWVNE